MNPDPSDEAVDNLIGMGLCTDRNDAIMRLRANGNDIQRAIEAYFENPSGNHGGAQTASQEWQNTWDEEQFHTDKTSYPDQNVPSFSIHSSDERPESLQPNVFGAPSRPPSRVNDREPIDLTDAHAAADPSKSMSAEDRENEDLRRAMELSMSDHNAQESGVTNASGSNFGPATRAHYETGKWELTRTHTAAHEIILDPEPADRRREDGEPVFLKPSLSGHYLSSMLTILHAIPVAREALLCRRILLADYGHDDEWWKGTAIKVPRVVDIGTQPLSAAEEEIIYETQRVLAFLDKSDRAYGSVEVLVKLSTELNQRLDMADSDFLNAWREAVARKVSPPPPREVFRSNGVKVSIATGDVIGHSLSSDIGLHLDNELAESDVTLYEALDDLIWEGLTIHEDTTVYLQDVADVFTMAVSRLDSSRPNRGIRIPAVWYADRYLKSSQGLAADMRAKKLAVNREMAEMAELEARLTSYQPAGRPAVDPRKLLQSAIGHFERKKEANGGEEEASVESGPDVLEELKATYARVTGKLESLEEQKEKARQRLREISSLMTEPHEDPDLNPTHRYTLRGVSTDPHVTYVLYPGTLESPPDPDDPNPREYQWWRLSYASKDAKPVTKMKVDEDLVLQAATEEGRSAVLVYANERAMDERRILPLPIQLENFVRADNLAFAAEVSGTGNAHGGQAAAQSSSDSPETRQSPKRKAAATSPSSSSPDRTWPANSPPDTPSPSPPQPVEASSNGGGHEMAERRQGDLVAGVMARNGGSGSGIRNGLEGSDSVMDDAGS
ncbi:MAG: hypothetical protein M1832_005774 [Thelocarpon impressellum]|nr:MAG: hypothetical protein M1832_005774 [Thelocarpon impressellum]